MFHEIIDRLALSAPGHSVAVFGERRLTAGELRSWMDNLGRSLQSSGVVPGGRVAILARNCLEYLAFYAACSKIGAVGVLVNTRLAPPEVAFILKDSTREVQFLFFGWAHTQGDGFVWLPRDRVLCTGDAAVNGPRNKLWDANLENWPRVLSKALAFEPLHILPGHGEAGGPEILTGQQAFLQDLYDTVSRQVAAGKALAQIPLVLPDRDRNWIPRDLTDDFAIAYVEITHHQPAGSLPHKWR